MKRFLTVLSAALILVGSMSIRSNAQSGNAKNTQPQKEYVYSMAMVEKQPEFPGGTQAMYMWLCEHINYPDEAVEKGVQGRVIVEFVINKNGEIENPRVLRGCYSALDEEAIRLVKAMPKWNPGLMNSKPVKVTYTLPITFKLPPKEEPAK